MLSILLVSGFFEDIGASFGIGPGNDKQREGNQLLGEAAGTLGSISQRGEGEAVAQAGQAGQALGEQRGRAAATGGARAALQAARTGGLNKGQAGLIGGQQSGDLYTRGFESGQDTGINAFQNATGQRIGAATGQAGVGQAKSGAGGQQAQALGGTIGGIAKGVGQAAMGGVPFADGGIVTEPTPGVVGEAGPEAVVPLKDPERAAEVMKPITPPDHLDTVIALSRKIAELEAKLAEPRNA